MFSWEGCDKELPLQNFEVNPVGTDLFEEMGMGICSGLGTVQEVFSH